MQVTGPLGFGPLSGLSISSKSQLRWEPWLKIPPSLLASQLLDPHKSKECLKLARDFWLRLYMERGLDES